jgi:hypothetical protein
LGIAFRRGAAALDASSGESRHVGDDPVGEGIEPRVHGLIGA